MMKDIVEYLYKIPRFARTGGLEATRERLRLLGSPEKSFHYIHVLCLCLHGILPAESGI